MSVVLITGAGKGIGLATALHFGRKGHTVYAGLRDPAAATELQEAISAESLPISLLVCDVDDDASVKAAVARVLDESKQIDVLVNNAAISVGGALETAPVDAAIGIFQTNYFGVVRMIQAVVPGMRERRSGAIVNLSSIYGRVVWATHAHYSATKHALEAASEALAQELRAFNIRVAIIEPGIVLTPMGERGRARRAANPVDPANPYAAHRRRLGKLHDMRLERPTMPEEVAETIEHAVTTETPKLRYLLGEDALGLTRARQETSDEEWVENGRPMEDDEYYDLMAKRCGVDLFR